MSPVEVVYKEGTGGFVASLEGCITGGGVGGSPARSPGGGGFGTSPSCFPFGWEDCQHRPTITYDGGTII